MNTEELKKLLKEKKNALLIKTFEYNKKTYIMAFKVVNDIMQYCYYEFNNNDIYDVNDFKLIESFRELQEINEEVIY